MSIKDWMAHWLDDHRSVATGSAAVQPDRPAAEELNLRDAIEVHQHWKVWLETAIRSQSVRDLDAQLVGREDACALGKWIHNAGVRRFGGDPQFLDLQAKHAGFHRCAARSVLLAQAGEQELALTEMSSSSAFASLSWEVIGDLASMLTRAEMPGALGGAQAH